MAFSGYSHLQHLILVLLLLRIPSTYQLSFSFSSFDPSNRDIEYEGDAFPINGTIKLTTDRNDSFVSSSSGRATYIKPVQVGNKSTGTLIDFNTNFSFFVTTNYRSGDGLAFFLAANRFLPPNSTGPCLGLFNCDKLKSPDSPFVAVEFDNGRHRWDPNDDHFGIDINSLRSVAVGPWFPQSRGANVRILYDSGSKTLTAFVTYDDMTNSVQSIFRVLDLRDFLPEWVIVGFSASTGGSPQKHTIVSWDFSSTLATVDAKTNITEPAGTPTNIGKHHGSKRNKIIAICISVPIGVLVLVSILIWFLCKKNRRSGGEDCRDEVSLTSNVRSIGEQGMNHGIVNDDGVSGNGMFGNNKHGPKIFSLGELVEATNDFESKAIIGKGGFGTVYKGFLRAQNMYVAIKRFNKNLSDQGIKEFEVEVNIISQLKHRNLVKLFGYYRDDDRRDLILVYDFMHNGSLHDNLFSEKTFLLKWEKRFDIAVDLARGLYYLHEGGEQYVVHRDIKSANVLLDSDFRAKLGDFGLARLVEQGHDVFTVYVAGTVGYLAPECAIYCKMPTKNSDVYSFGVVLLEIGCGKRALVKDGEGTQQLVQWVWKLYGKEKLLEAVDKRLSTEHHKQQIERLLVLGLWCAHPDPLSRPSIQRALHVLESEEAKLPNLPRKMPKHPVASESSSSSSVERSTIIPNNKGKNTLQDPIKEEDQNSCAHLDSLSRPSIQRVPHVLESEEVTLPNLQSNMLKRKNPMASESSSSSSVERSTRIPNNKGKNVLQDPIKEEEDQNSCAHPDSLSRPSIQRFPCMLQSEKVTWSNLPSNMLKQKNPEASESSTSTSMEGSTRFLNNKGKDILHDPIKEEDDELSLRHYMY